VKRIVIYTFVNLGLRSLCHEGGLEVGETEQMRAGAPWNILLEQEMDIWGEILTHILGKFVRIGDGVK